MSFNTEKELLVIETAIQYLVLPIMKQVSDNRQSPYLRRFLVESTEHLIENLLSILSDNNISTTQRTINESIGNVFVGFMSRVEELQDINSEHEERIKEIDREINKLKKERGIISSKKKDNYVEYSKSKLEAEVMRRLYLRCIEYQNDKVENRGFFQ